MWMRLIHKLEKDTRLLSTPKTVILKKKKKIKNLLLFRPQILSSVFQALEIVSKMTFIQFAYSCYIQNEAQLLLQ